MTNPEQVGQIGVPARLFQHPAPRINQQQRRVRGRRACDHVARVLHVTGRVGKDELAPRRGEVAVRDINRDALFALRAQAVGQVGEVHILLAARSRRTLNRFHLIDERLLRVKQQPADQC